MNLQRFFYLLYPLYGAKNSVQYLIGTFLFIVFFGKFSLITFLIGYVSFTLSYVLVYAVNDIVDYKNDLRDKKMLKRKILAKSPLIMKYATPSELIQFAVLVSTFGLILGTLLGFYFILTLVVMIFLNMMFYSNPFVKIKTTFIAFLALIVIQFLKFSTGFLAQDRNFNFSLTQFVIFSSLSIFYALFYKFYKRNFGLREDQMNKKNSSILILVFLISLVLILAVLLKYFHIE